MNHFEPGVFCVVTSGHSGSRGALGALMTCLRAARAQGVLPGFDQAVQDGLVPLPLLQLALLHKHHQVSSNRSNNKSSSNSL